MVFDQSRSSYKNNFYKREKACTYIEIRFHMDLVLTLDYDLGLYGFLLEMDDPN